MPRNNALNLGQLNDGQLMIGNSNGPIAAANIAAGSGIIVTNGANSITIATSGTGRLINVRYLTGSGTYTPTAGTVSCLVVAQAAGGGGAGSPYSAVTNANPNLAGATYGHGGSAGALGFKFYATAPTSASYNVGTGGAGGTGGTSTTSATAGGPGGATTFNGQINLLGGNGGEPITTTTSGGQQPPVLSYAGGAVGAGDTCDIAWSGNASPYWGIAQTLPLTAIFCLGAGSYFCPGAGTSPSASPAPFRSNGVTPTGYGGGGSGGMIRNTTAAQDGGDGGAGAPGIIIIYEYGA